MLCRRCAGLVLQAATRYRPPHGGGQMKAIGEFVGGAGLRGPRVGGRKPGAGHGLSGINRRA